MVLYVFPCLVQKFRDGKTKQSESGKTILHLEIAEIPVHPCGPTDRVAESVKGYKKIQTNSPKKIHSPLSSSVEQVSRSVSRGDFNSPHTEVDGDLISTLSDFQIQLSSCNHSWSSPGRGRRNLGSGKSPLVTVRRHVTRRVCLGDEDTLIT